jgi:fermentation-respiration switch protein FrsA (DUF1100 family)
MVVLKRRAARVAATLAVGALLFYAGSAAWLFLRQTEQVYHPSKDFAETPAARKLAYDEVAFKAADGTKLVAWWIPVENPKGTILFCHGNARNIGSDIHVYDMFHRFGYNVFAIDYRGYGHSEGRPSEKGTYADARAGWDWLLTQKNLKPRDVVVWGRSLGAGVATELAVSVPEPPRALVTEAAFTSLADIAAELHPGMPVRLFILFHYDNLAKFPKLRCPVLVVHSREDQLINLRHGKRLFAAAPEPKRFLEIKGPHAGLPWQPGYEEGLTAFLDSVA